MKFVFNDLIIFEMANNHMGDLNFGLKIIEEYSELKEKYKEKLQFAFKFQLRDIDSFIYNNPHNYVLGENNEKYIKRFKETKLSIEDLKTLKNKAKELGFITMCTAFDEKSVDLIEELDFEIIKIGSCSFTDWPLLNRIVKTSLPIIASTATYGIKEINNVVDFLKNRNKTFALMHCVGEYPTSYEDLKLDFIDVLKKEYNIDIGFSTHEHPNEVDSIKIAISKGATLFEKHVAINTTQYNTNLYSVFPTEMDSWLKALIKAKEACKIKKTNIKEYKDVKTFKRGVFAKNDIKKGETIDRSNIYYAWPNLDNQILANDMSKYTYYIAEQDIQKDHPIFNNNLKIDTREFIWGIVQKIQKLIVNSNITIPKNSKLEISHHYGLASFHSIGISMVTVINKDYCKKYIIMLPNQHHPSQYHKIKNETFHILYGDMTLNLNNIKNELDAGDVIHIEPNTIHNFTAGKNGCILEEISSTHYKDDSYYLDDKINNSKNRKTYIDYWL